MPNDRKMDQHLDIESHGDVGITKKEPSITLLILPEMGYALFDIAIVDVFHFRWFGLAV